MPNLNMGSARMALTSLSFAVFAKRGGSLRALCADVEEAAVLVSYLGEGAVVVHSGPGGINPSRLLWAEGPDADGCAADSFDETSEVMLSR